MDATSKLIATMYSLDNTRLRELLAEEREAGRAFGHVAEAARTLLQLRTGSPS
jgi:hypothetical protein